jgi:serine/threonine protein kinase
MNDSGPLPVLLALQVKDLAGRVWKLNGRTYRLDQYGGHEFRQGKEGINIGLFDEQGKLAAYLKSFMGIALTPKRVARTKWLIEQDLGSWGPEFRGAPKQWVDTRVDGRPQGIDFEFTCYLMDPVPGQTWEKAKELVTTGEAELTDFFRWRCVQSLLRAQVVLERNGIIHGDLSPNNLKIDFSAGMHDPAAYVFDFDAFVAPSAGELGTLTTEEGGVFGTEGYCPPDLHEGMEQAEADIAPYSDRYGRDMLVLELLCYDRSLPFDLPPSHWPREVLRERLQRIGVDRAVPYLTRPDLFELPESGRPSAAKLAEQFGMNVPPPIKRRGRPIGTTSRWKVFRLQGDLLAKTLSAALILLWLLCSAHWAIISHRVGGWLVGADPSTSPPPD